MTGNTINNPGDTDKARLYAELELKWNRRFGWFLSRALMVTGFVAIILYILLPATGNHIIDALFGAAGFYVMLNVVLFFRERRLQRFLRKV